MLFSGECKERIFTKASDVGQIVECVTSVTEIGGHTDARENFAVCLFLIVCFAKSKMGLPIKVLRRQSPDFLLCYGAEQKLLGLEHTRATTEKYAMDMKGFEQYPEGSLLELPPYDPNEKLPKKSRIAMRKPGEKLISPGWGDYGMERAWIPVMSSCIEHKTEVLNKEHYEKFPSNDLIVEDESHVSVGKRLHQSISMLREKHLHAPVGGQCAFDKVHVVTEGRLVYDVFGEALETSIRPAQLHEMWDQHLRQS